MDFARLIEEITEQVIKRLEEEEKISVFSSSLPALLIPLSYGFITWQESSIKVGEIFSGGKFNIIPVADTREQEMIEGEWGKDFFKFYSCNQLNSVSHKLLRDVHLVLVPVFSLYSLARVAGLSPLLLTERIVLDAIQAGKKIIICRDEFFPDSDLRKKAGFDRAPGAFNRKIKDYMENLSSYGVIFIELENMVSAVEFEFGLEKPAEIKTDEKKREVITNEDIILFASSGNKLIRVSPGAIITPLAADTAKEMGVEIIRE